MTIFKLPLFHLYLLQLENFDLARFWRIFLSRGLLWYSNPRKSIIWTVKLRLIFTISVLIQLLLTMSATAISYFIGLLVFAGGFFMYPLFYTIATLVFFPFDFLIKQFFIQKATAKMHHYPDVKIVAIAGSYGKTTTKEFIASALSQKYRVLKTPENINTPLGISRLILKKLTSDIEVFVVEMGEFYPGDIKEICDIVKPDIALVTGINEAHLERLKNLDQTAATIFEVVTHAHTDAPILLNADDERVTGYFNKQFPHRKGYFYSSRPNQRSEYTVGHIKFRADGTGQSFTLTKNKKSIHFSTQLLGSYAIGDTMAALVISNLLGVSKPLVVQTITHLAPVPHRLQLLRNESNILVIDDSYNGNSAGVEQALYVLSQFRGRRKVFVTPGLVETGSLAHQVHTSIGKKLAKVADLVLLIQNSVTASIVQGLKEGNFPPENIVFFSDAGSVYSQLKQYLKPGDVVLLQNDWPENYI